MLVNMARMVIRVRCQDDHIQCLGLIQQFNLDATEVDDFDVQFYDRRDFKFMHHLLKRLGMPHCMITCYD